jgi:ABC-type transport system substrate-binding protein
VAWPSGARRPRRRRGDIGSALVGASVVLGVALALALLVMLGRTAYLAWTIEVPASGGRYVEAYVGQPNALNPLLAATDPADREFLPLLFAGLTRVAPDGSVEPDLAEGWEVSPDGRTYTFRLRPSLRWSDGSALEADDVAFTFATLQAPDFPAEADVLGPWRQVQVETPDARTVRMTLSRPWAGLLEAAALGVVPRAALEGTRGREWLDHPFNTAPVGAGPYRVADFTVDELVLVPNPWYHGPRPHLAELRFRFYPTAQAAAQAVQTGESAGLALRASPETAPLRLTPGLAVHEQPDYARPVLLWLNTGAPPFDARAVRVAAALAIDRARVVASLDAALGSAGPPSAPLGVPAWGPLPPTSWAYAADTPFPQHAPARAAALLDAAGWQLRPGGERARNGTPLSVTLATNDDPLRRAAADAVARDLRAVGFRVEVAVRPWEDLLREDLAPKRYQALLLGQWTPTADPDGLRDLWRSDGSANLAQWHHPGADDLLARAGAATDRAERRAAYAAFQALWAEEVPSVPLYYPVLTWAVRADLQGVDLSSLADASMRLALVPHWYVQTQRVLRGW